MKQSREWIAGAVLATAGAVFALVMLEVGVRMLHLVPDRFWEPDPMLGARLVAGKRGWWSQEEREFLVPIEVNQHGLHDVEHDYEKKPGVVRVLVLGDSFVEALHVPLEDSFARRLQSELDKDRRDVEVIGAGVSGYGTAGAVLLFEREGVRYKPDVVVLAFYPGNDVRNNSPTLEDTLRPVYGPDGELQKVESIGGRGMGGGGGWSRAYQYLRKLVLTRQPALAKVLADVGLMKPEAIRMEAERDGVPVTYGVYGAPLDAEWEDAWKHTEGLLARLKRDVEAAGAKFAVAIVTAREVIYPDTWEEILAAHPDMRARRWELGSPTARLLGWCTASGVPCLDLDDAFVKARDSGSEALHFHHDGHWTPAGHAVAATAVKTFIEGQQLLPAN